MQGGADKANEAGIPIVGGHSIDDNEPKYGLVVTGEVSNAFIWKNQGAKEGDALILTKPIGTGIIATAIKKEKASISIVETAIKSMSMLNKKASEILKKYNPNAVTDVTGFGLIGHLIEMVKKPQVAAGLIVLLILGAGGWYYFSSQLEPFTADKLSYGDEMEYTISDGKFMVSEG